MRLSDSKVRIVDASAPDRVEIARRLIHEYADWLKVDRCLHGFAEELASLPGGYAPPKGRLLLAYAGHEPAAVVALRPFGESAGEVKRLWVRPQFRGAGVGRALVESLIAEAKRAGYGRLVLDTLGRMRAAAGLYRSLGFKECAPFGVHPEPDTICMELGLHRDA